MLNLYPSIIYVLILHIIFCDLVVGEWLDALTGAPVQFPNVFGNIKLCLSVVNYL